MTKILLVEDDKSLREIYGVRLRAEGYDIVSAGDGEEALALAIKERPELVISDVMMPKVSGFDMLDILRSTSETKNIHVIVMTALSSEEQRQRGEMLGADKYLVKSQVGIEDVVRAVHEVMRDAPVDSSEPANPFAMPLTSTPPVTPIPNTSPADQPIVEPTPSPIDNLPLSPVGQPTTPPQASPQTTAPMPQPPVPQTSNQSLSPEQTQPTPAPVPVQQPPVPVQPQTAEPPQQTPVPIAPQTAPTPAPAPISASPVTPITTIQNPVAIPEPSTVNDPDAIISRPGNRVIQPLGDPSKPMFDIGNLLDREFAKSSGAADIGQPNIMTTAEERAVVQEQVQTYSDQLTSSQANDSPESPSNAPMFGESSSTSSEIDAGAPPANIPSVPLQSRQAEPVIMPPEAPDQPTSALSGTTLPPNSIM